MNFIKNLVAVLISVSLLGFGVAFASSQPVGTTQFYLSGAGITATQTTIQLTSFKTPDGTLLTMSNFGTVGYGALEPQSSARLEDISFTGVTQNANGTATLTGVSRGISFTYPYAATASLGYSHSGGSIFIITNTAQFYYNEFAMFNNNNVTTWPNASTSVATKGYADYLAFNGAGVINADTSNRGIVQISTGAQAAASTGAGSSGALLVLPSSVATSTYNSNTAGNVIPVTGSGTKTIDGNFLPTNFPTGHVMQASTTFAATTTLSAPAVIDTSGNQLLWTFIASTSVSTATTTLTLPARNISMLRVVISLTADGGNDAVFLNFNGDEGQNYNTLIGTSSADMLSANNLRGGITLSRTTSAAPVPMYVDFNVFNDSSTAHKLFGGYLSGNSTTTSSDIFNDGFYSGVWATSTAQRVTSLILHRRSTDASAMTGTIYVFGSSF